MMNRTKGRNEGSERGEGEGQGRRRRGTRLGKAGREVERKGNVMIVE